MCAYGHDAGNGVSGYAGYGVSPAVHGGAGQARAGTDQLLVEYNVTTGRFIGIQTIEQFLFALEAWVFVPLVASLALKALTTCERTRFMLIFPTIIFWNSYHWELKTEVKPFFDLLEGVAIFCKTLEAAAKK